MPCGKKKTAKGEKPAEVSQRGEPRSVQLDLGRGIHARVDVRPMDEAEQQQLVADMEVLLTEVIRRQAIR